MLNVDFCFSIFSLSLIFFPHFFLFFQYFFFFFNIDHEREGLYTHIYEYYYVHICL